MLRSLLLFCCLFFALHSRAQSPWRDTLFGGKAGIADTNGRIIIPPVYDEVTPYTHQALDWNSGTLTGSDETVFIVRRGKLRGLLDAHAEKILDISYDDVVVDYSDGGSYRVIAAKKGKYYAFFDPGGKAITGFIFTEIDTGDFGDGIIAYVKRKGDKRFQLLDKQGGVHPEQSGL